MPTRRRLLAGAVYAALAGCSGDGGGDGSGGPGGPDDPEDSDASAGDDGAGLSVAVPAVESTIPVAYTCDGEDVSPPIELEGVPVEAESLAVVVEDPDAPRGEPFVHWLLWNVPAETTEIPEGIPREETVGALDGAAQGTNDFGEIGYRGPCPPTEDDAHRYRFTVRALDWTLSLEPGAERDAFESAIEGHEIGEATVTADHGR